MTATDPKKPPHYAGIVTPRSIEREMKESYLTYALSVIHSRALPDVRDGLKPSQRRILVAMNDLNLGPRAKYRKCAKIAGDTSGNYHPHGEAVIYPTLVRMAQDFSLRYPLIDGQGNFGSIDDDPPAAMRYTEARMSGIAVELMADLDKETVDLEPNYDNTRMQPIVLPSRFPNLLCNGDLAAAAQPARNLRGAAHRARPSLGGDRRAVRNRQGSGFPHRRHRDGQERHSAGLSAWPRPGAGALEVPRRGPAHQAGHHRHRDSVSGAQVGDHREDRRGREG
jgi:hypothetical protein